MKFQFLPENFSRSENAPPFETRKIRLFEVERIFLKNKKMLDDFGYGLRKEFWHKGIVTEAGRAVIEQVKKDGLPYITATHDRNNPRSGGVMRNAGMEYQYSYEEQWKPKNVLVTFRLYQLNLDGNESRVYKKYWDTSAVHFIEPDL